MTVPQPFFGDTRMFLVAVPRPMPLMAAWEPDDAPKPGSVPGATRMCTPFSISASVTAAMALPMAAQSQATSTTLPKVDPNCGVFAGQWVPLGP